MKRSAFCTLTRAELALAVVAAFAVGACTASLIAFAYVRSATAGCPIDDEPVARPAVIASLETA